MLIGVIKTKHGHYHLYDSSSTETIQQFVEKLDNLEIEYTIEYI